MNEYDTNRIYDIVKRINYKKTENLNEADCYVLNTCHIREKATDKVYHDIGRIKKNFKNKKKPIVIVSGCVAQAEGEILLKNERYIDAILGPQSYHKLNETLIKIEKDTKKVNFTNFEVERKFDDLKLIRNSSSKISAFLTIQEGCDKFCKFCVVPYTRGAEYSRPVKELFKECKDLIDNGAREIILLGQNVNAYNSNGKKLSHLIEEISKIEDLKRIRYTTSHPIDFSYDLIEAHKRCNKLMPLIHLPVQSGSNRILQKMNRKHSIKDYMILLNKIKKANPLVKFSSDFIIGYPGETNNDFEETVKLMKNVKFINSYSFIFSPRPGTPAAKFVEVNANISKERLKFFQKIAEEIKLNYKKSIFNKNSSVLFENRIGNKNEFFGRDEYLNSVIVKSEEELVGKIKTVNILGGNQNTLNGKVIEKINTKNFAA